MPWKRMPVSEQRVRFVIRATSGRETMQGLCREFGISRPTGYLWRRRYKEVGTIQGLVERGRRPHHSPRQTSREKEQRVVALRREYGWGARKLQVLLIEQGQSLPVRTIHRVLKRHGLIGEEGTTPAAGQRFEREAPNELWQMDGKGEYVVRDGTCYPLSILDDHSRYAVGLYPLRAFTAAEVNGCLVKTFERYGVPEAMLMDHGAQWWSSANGYGLTWLGVRLIEQGISLHFGRVRHPQTQGKVERFHRTLAEAIKREGRPQTLAEWGPALERFQQIYNERRPHEALGMLRPADRYRPSSKQYQAQPPQWEYPQGSEVRRLNTQGFLNYRGRRWFVSEALASRWVRVEHLDGKVLLSYRHMYVREIDLASEITRPVVFPRERQRGADVRGGVLRSPSGLPSDATPERKNSYCPV